MALVHHNLFLRELEKIHSTWYTHLLESPKHLSIVKPSPLAITLSPLHPTSKILMMSRMSLKELLLGISNGMLSGSMLRLQMMNGKHEEAVASYVDLRANITKIHDQLYDAREKDDTIINNIMNFLEGLKKDHSEQFTTIIRILTYIQESVKTEDHELKTMLQQLTETYFKSSTNLIDLTLTLRVANIPNMKTLMEAIQNNVIYQNDHYKSLVDSYKELSLKHTKLESSYKTKVSKIEEVHTTIQPDLAIVKTDTSEIKSKASISISIEKNSSKDEENEPKILKSIDEIEPEPTRSIAKDTGRFTPKHVNASGKIRASPRGSSKTFKVLLGDGTLFRGTHDEVSMIQEKEEKAKQDTLNRLKIFKVSVEEFKEANITSGK
ncbi:hypothetical protein Tco_0373494 [Tanacetum coccineum]